MKAKIITSILFGFLLPWLYFVMVDTFPMNLYKEGVLISKAVQKSQLELFIDFYGWQKTLALYFKSFVICALSAYAICTVYDITVKKLIKTL